jgi:hypothetical protein
VERLAAGGEPVTVQEAVTAPDEKHADTVLVHYVIKGMKRAIREMPGPAARAELWRAFTRWLESARILIPDEVMPWEDTPDLYSDTRIRIANRDVKAGIEYLARSLVWEDSRHPEDQKYPREYAEAMVHRFAREVDRLADAPGPKCRVCGKPARTARSSYCSNSHRQQAYAQRKRLAQSGQPASPYQEATTPIG